MTGMIYPERVPGCDCGGGRRCTLAEADLLTVCCWVVETSTYLFLDMGC